MLSSYFETKHHQNSSIEQFQDNEFFLQVQHKMDINHFKYLLPTTSAELVHYTSLPPTNKSNHFYESTYFKLNINWQFLDYTKVT